MNRLKTFAVLLVLLAAGSAFAADACPDEDYNELGGCSPQPSLR